MKYFVILILLISSLAAKDNLSGFLKAYKLKDMTAACIAGKELFYANIRDENILLAIGKACSKADYIDFVGVLQQRLGQSPSSRKAAVYFSTLLLKKRLISQYMHEDIDLSAYSLPLTDHILSRVYEAIKNENFTLVSKDPKRLHIGDAGNYIDLYVKKKIYVDLYQKGKKIQGHRYK